MRPDYSLWQTILAGASLILAAVGLVATLVIYFLKEKKPEDTVGALVKWSAGVLSLLVVALLAVAYILPDSTTQDQGPTPTTSTPMNQSPTTPASTSGNPPPSPVPRKMLAALAITKSAIFQGPRNQFQVKLRLRIQNVSEGGLDAKLEHVRLLIPGDAMPGGWTPRVPTAEPSVVTLDDGKRYVAVPANQNHDCEPINAPCLTFASLWFPPDPLLPGDYYEGQPKVSGDVVYYVPPSPGGEFKGIALVSGDGTSVLGYQELNQYDGNDNPRDF